MITVTILKGIPASGKSTWARQMLDQHPGMYKRINKDDLRAMLDNAYWSKGNEAFVLKVRDYLITEALKEGKHVIVDDTNLDPKHEARIRELVSEYARENDRQIKVQVKEFNVTLEESIERDAKRPVPVGEKAIRGIHNRYVAPVGRIPFYCQQDTSLPKAIICDIDGTLALINDRNPFDASRCEQDLVNEPVLNIVNQYAKAGFVILLLSGRSSEHRIQTTNWLSAKGVSYDALFMRKQGDMRKDSIVKKELYESHIQGIYYIEFVLDDRNQVVDMWRKEIGLLCLQVYYGDF
ncbi:AAA family ATPase [Rhodocytophaga rosea]|uniref:AAA family ATPase n=1 Tax=Rhodocytophaga rosea TaxID=2704465 RepID=A0A6C0GCM5_9BACT|nr:AAA family ATPase [Rhodocytophaga rosea]QHT65430.1 AAA family ATPase [Rhodocytophaga rosea]